MRKNRHSPYTNRHSQSGQVLIYALGIVAVLLIAVFVMLSITTGSGLDAQRSAHIAQASNLAEAGIDKAIDQLKSNANYSGETNTTFGPGAFSTTVTGSGSTRTITATGTVAGHDQTIRVQVSIGTTTVQFFYGVQVDDGGMTMSNNATVTGNVFANGSLTGNNGAHVTGTAIVAGGAAATVNQSQMNTNATQSVGQTSANADIAQSFVPSATDILTKISVYVAKVGAPANLPVDIVTDANNQPTKTMVATGTIPAASIGTTASWVDLSFVSPPQLTSGTRYWIILDGTANASNYYVWSKDAADSYANGTPMNSANWNASHPSWSNLTGDQAFQIYLGGTPTKIDKVNVGGDAHANTLANLTVSHDAYFQTLSNATVLGTQHPNSPDSSHQDLPISDGVMTDWKNQAAVGGTVTGDYTLTNSAAGSLGPRKITGNLNLSNGATLTVTGTLWVQGNITLSNNCTVKLDSSYGADSGIIIADGTVTVSNNCQFTGSGQTGSYIMLAAAKNDPGSTVMDINNNAIGVIYYAGHGRIHFKNNAAAKEATAYGMDLDNNATITYESGLANVHFSSGPGGGWAVVPGTWQIVRP